MLFTDLRLLQKLVDLHHPAEKLDFSTSLLPKQFLRKRGLYNLDKCLIWTIRIINNGMSGSGIY